MQWLTRLWSRERRSGGRETAGRDVFVFRSDQPVGRALLVNASDGGARLTRLQGSIPADVFVFVEMETAQAQKVEVVWRDADTVGVRILKSQRLRGFVPPAFAKLKVFWEAASVERMKTRSG